MDGYDGQLGNGAIDSLAMALQCCDGWLGDVVMDGLQWTAHNEWLVMDGSAMGWTACDGQLAMDGSAMERWTARRCSDGRPAMGGSQWLACNGRLGDGAMDSLRWTACDGRLGDGVMGGLAMERWTASNGWLGNGKMDGSQ